MIRHRRALILTVAGVLFASASVAAAAPSAELGSLGLQAGAISAAVGSRDISKASDAWDGLFSGSAVKKYSTGGAAVVAGEWTYAPRPALALSRPRERGAKFTTVMSTNDAIEAARKKAEQLAREAERAAREIAERDRQDEAKRKYGGCRMKGTCPK